ncbi:hypothetical protein LTR53_010886 [Teratosphaeriaceae sp. CCFEE 6253]|nr:hypothetical protein LTR53_010886 [Teratosphaeriaceae sp. CCFEE 6253]
MADVSGPKKVHFAEDNDVDGSRITRWTRGKGPDEKVRDGRQSRDIGARIVGGGRTKEKRHRKVIRDTIQGVTRPAIRRLARRGGVVRISAGVYEETRVSLLIFLRGVIKDVCAIVECRKQKTVTTPDVVFALNRIGRTLYVSLHLYGVPSAGLTTG